MKNNYINRTTWTYNTILKALVKIGSLEGAEKWIEDMQKKGFLPDTPTYNPIILAHIRLNNSEIALQLYKDMKMEQKINTHLGGALVECFLQNGDQNGAIAMVQRLESGKVNLSIHHSQCHIIHSDGVVDVNIWEMLVDDLVRTGKTDQALEVVKKYPVYAGQANPSTCMMLLSALVEEQRLGKALNFFHQIKNWEIECTFIGCVVLIPALMKQNMVLEAMETYTLMKEELLEDSTSAIDLFSIIIEIIYFVDLKCCSISQIRWSKSLHQKAFMNTLGQCTRTSTAPLMIQPLRNWWSVYKQQVRQRNSRNSKMHMYNTIIKNYTTPHDYNDLLSLSRGG